MQKAFDGFADKWNASSRWRIYEFFDEFEFVSLVLSLDKLIYPRLFKDEAREVKIQ